MPVDPWLPAREAARRLIDAGCETWFAGGCVRDHLLGRAVADVDIATAATPDEVRALFPRSLDVGLSFGIVVVPVPDGHPLEIATFRTEGAYADGRRPDAVAYTRSAAEDVQRRDFTINALLMHPLTGAVIDHVGGQADLAARLIRAVGDPRRRFAEDRLRVLRALRFAAAVDFTIDSATWSALVGADLSPLSRERIWQEFLKATSKPGGGRFIALVHEAGLQPWPFAADAQQMERACGMDPAVRFAVLDPAADPAYWKAQPLPRATIDLHRWLCMQPPLPTDIVALRRIARDPRSRHLYDLLVVRGADVTPLTTAWAWLEAHPIRPLVTGDDLRARGIAPGPALGAALRKIDDAQLAGRVTDRDQAFAEVGIVL